MLPLQDRVITEFPVSKPVERRLVVLELVARGPRARPKAHLRRQMHGIFGRYVSIEQTDGRNNGTGVLRPASEVLILRGTGPLVTRNGA